MANYALLAAIAYFICHGGNWLIGQSMLERPIVVGAVTGLLFGDVKTGVMIGAALEAIYMGAVNIGGAVSAEPVSATVMACAFSIVSGINTEAAITLAVPIGIVAAFVGTGQGVLFNLFGPMIDRVAEKNDERGLYLVHYGMWLLNYGSKAVIVYLGVLLGSEPLTQAMNSIPTVLMTGLTTTGAIMGAVGMAILMRMLWSKELAVYFFAGFILVKYFNIPLVAVAAIGLIIAVLVAQRDKEVLDLSRKGIGSSENKLSDEEVFFE